MNYLFEKMESCNFFFDYVSVIQAFCCFHVTGMSSFTAQPFSSQEEMYKALTLHTFNVMDYVLAGIAFDDSISFPENVQVRKSVVKNCDKILSAIRLCIHLILT